MNRIHTIKPFGEINFNNTEADYTLYDYKLNNSEITIDLNFDKEVISDDILYKLKSFLEKLPELSKEINAEIEKEYKFGDTVKEYIDHHFKDCEKDELKSIGIDTNKTDTEIKTEMFNKIHLVRIGLYPEYENFSVFDFTLDKDITQHLVVVNTNDVGDVNNIVIES